MSFQTGFPIFQDLLPNHVVHTSSTKAFSVFTSMLSLGIGLDICFFKGMNTYWKTWIQLVFPMYDISLVIMIPIVSRHSIRFPWRLQRKIQWQLWPSWSNFHSLSQAELKYSNDTHKTVWLPDANINYLTRKHIPHFIVAILILTIWFVYTFILFCWQWLLKCTKYHRLCHFFQLIMLPIRLNIATGLACCFLRVLASSF